MNLTWKILMTLGAVLMVATAAVVIMKVMVPVQPPSYELPDLQPAMNQPAPQSSEPQQPVDLNAAVQSSDIDADIDSIISSVASSSFDEEDQSAAAVGDDEADMDSLNQATYDN